MKVLLALAISLMLLVTSASAIAEYSPGFGSRDLNRNFFSVWSTATGSNKCTSTAGYVDCFSESYTNTYGSATAVAYADILATHALEVRDPDCHDASGTPLFIAPLTVKYKCFSGDKAYVMQGINSFPSCNINGCAASESPLTGQISFPAGTNSIPSVYLQCWDYNKMTVGSTWTDAWTWVGINYPSYNAKVVDSCPIVTTCNDNIKNGDETGTDCGGTKCAACVTAPSCRDGVKNGLETGVDCGGSLCPACTVQTTCNNGVKDGQETGIDCGGSCSACAAESCSDGVKNQDETAIDCGGKCSACGKLPWYQFLIDFWNWIVGLFK